MTIIEHKSQLGKKILSTGNGKCNLTNTVMTTDCFRGENLSIVEQVLQQFGYRETLDFFEAVGLLVRNRRGYIYPLSEQASAVVDVLVMELEKCGVQILLEEHVTGITKEATLFCVTTEKGTRYADAVILQPEERRLQSLALTEADTRLRNSLAIRFPQLFRRWYNFAEKELILNRSQVFAQCESVCVCRRSCYH